MFRFSESQFVATLLSGATLAIAWLLLCEWISHMPVLSPVSLAFAFRPWWRHWPITAALLVLPFLVLLALASLRWLFERIRDRPN
jgi:hypothetical protein